MIVVDANLLIYAYDRSSPVHEPSRRWLTEAFSGQAAVGFSWPTILAFVRITTQPKLFENPFSIEDAVSIVDDWLSQPQARLLNAGEGHWALLRRLLLEADARGKLVMDAHLAALALENDSVLISRDGDFDLFPDVKTFNPLI